MNIPESNSRREHVDEATSRRLGKLRTAPVDSSKFLKELERQIPRHQVQPRGFKKNWLNSTRAVAASLLLFGLIAVLIIHSASGPVLASADKLARIHEEVLHSDGSHVTRVNSIEAARAALNAKLPGLPAIPQLPDAHVMSCCVHELGRKKIACVAIQVDGVPVSLAIADAADVKMPPCDVLTIGGATYQVQSYNGINMLMTERGERWVCLIGKIPVNRLGELASTLQF